MNLMSQSYEIIETFIHYYYYYLFIYILFILRSKQSPVPDLSIQSGCATTQGPPPNK